MMLHATVIRLVNGLGRCDNILESEYKDGLISIQILSIVKTSKVSRVKMPNVCCLHFLQDETCSKIVFIEKHMLVILIVHS